MRHRLGTIAGNFGLAAVYFGAAKFGLSLAFVNASASAVWPPTGIALAVLLLWGHRFWPGIFAGAFFANITTQGTLLTTLGIATGNTLEAVLGVWLVNRFAGGRDVFERAREIFKYILLVVVASTAVSATFGVTSLALGEFVKWSEYLSVWITWWMGDAVGALIITPLIVIWSTTQFSRWRRARIVEAAIIFAGVLLVGVIGYGDGINAPVSRYSRFLLYPTALWAAYRFGQRGAITAIFLVACLAVWGTRRGFGPYASPDPNQSLLLLQTFLGSFTMTNLVLGTVVSERERNEKRLRVQEAMSRVLAESPTLVAATPKILQVICEVDGWDVGAIWTVNRAVNELSCVEFWYVPATVFPDFEAVTRQRTFKPGVGLPGRAWSSGKPEWVLDVTKDSNFPRAQMASKSGLRTGFAFPLKLGHETLGVIECFSRELRTPDEHFQQTFADIGTELGQFIERKQAEEALRQSQERIELILDAALDAVVTIDVQGCIRDWNPQAEKIFGWTKSEVRGRRLSETVIPPRYREAHERGLKHFLATGEGPLLKKRIEIFGMHREGREFPVELAITPVTVDRRIFFSAFIRDITKRREAELTLQESESRFRRLASHAPVGIFMSAANGDALYVNETWCAMAGLTAEQALGEKWLQAVHPEDRENVEAGWREAVEHGIESAAEFRFLRTDGRVVWVQGNAVKLQDAKGALAGYVGTLADITERKRAEGSLRESEARFRHLADSAPALIWMAGPDKKCTYFNQPWLKFTGRTLEQELGDGWAEGVHSEDVARCLDIYVTSFDARKEFEMEYRLRRCDGEYRWLLDRGVPRFTSAGEFLGYIGSCIDITARKEAETQLENAKAELAQTNEWLERRVRERTVDLIKANEDLQASEKRFRSLVESSPDATVIVGQNGEILLVNSQTERVFGYTREEMLGQPLEILLPERYRQHHVSHRTNFFADPRLRPMGSALELSGRRKDGSEFPVEISLSPLQTPEGTLVYSAIRDITERKRNEAARARLQSEILQVSEREQRRIAEDLHDGVGQQLGGIACLSDVLRKNLAQQDSSEAETATKISKLLTAAVAQTRGLARGLHPVPPESYGLMSALEDLAARVTDVFKVSCRFECEQAVLIANNTMATHLYRIAQEAITNAIKHGQAQHIDVRLSSSAEGISLSVTDDGIGFQDNDRHPKGMGLRIMSHRAGMIGGNVVVQMKSGGGTEMHCTVRKDIG